jgi:hypothetical protein
MTKPADTDDLRQFAKEVYKALNGRECPTLIDAIEFGIPEEFMQQAIDYWVEEGFMERRGIGTAEVCLTHEGATEIGSWPD